MIEDRDEENEEGIEAMTRALTNHSVAWWEMRKKQLPQKNNHRIVENNTGMGVVPINYDKGGGGGGGNNDDDDDYEGNFEVEGDFVYGHPMLLEDPSTIGYTMSALRVNSEPFASTTTPSSVKRKPPAIVYGSRDVVLRRRTIQGLYIFVSLCTVILFIVLLGQRKLSNYSMVGSSISLSAYLVMGKEGMSMIQQTEPSNGNAGDWEVGNTGY
jgi:hypothetical protein